MFNKKDQKNKYKGDVTIKLAGMEHVMRPTWAAVAGIEADLGEGFVAIATRLTNSKHGVRDLTAIVYHGIVASEPTVPPTRQQVSQIVMEAGLMNPDILSAVIDFSHAVLFGGQDLGKSEEAKQE